MRPPGEWRYFSICVASVLPPGAAAVAVATADLHERCAREAVPLDGGIAARLVRVEQLAVLDEQQRVAHQRGDGVEAPVAARGLRHLEDGGPLRSITDSPARVFSA